MCNNLDCRSSIELCDGDGRIRRVAICLSKREYAIPRWEQVSLDEGVRVEEWEMYRKSLLGMTATECRRRWGERFKTWDEHGLQVVKVENWTIGRQREEQQHGNR